MKAARAGRQTAGVGRVLPTPAISRNSLKLCWRPTPSRPTCACSPAQQNFLCAAPSPLAPISKRYFWHPPSFFLSQGCCLGCHSLLPPSSFLHHSSAGIPLVAMPPIWDVIWAIYILIYWTQWLDANEPDAAAGCLVEVVGKCHCMVGNWAA